jgi:hypothetical protein
MRDGTYIWKKNRSHDLPRTIHIIFLWRQSIDDAYVTQKKRESWSSKGTTLPHKGIGEKYSQNT